LGSVEVRSLWYKIGMNEVKGFPDSRWVRDLSSLDGESLRADLGTLSMEQQADLVLSLDWQHRMRIIRNSPAPRELVARLPDEEVLLTVKGLGEEDTLDLIALTSPEQLRFMLDVELWSGDTVDDGRVIRWLTYILACGEEKVVEFLKIADRDLLVMVLGKLVCLVLKEPDAAEQAGRGGIMEDEFFTILPRHPKETENVKLLLRVIRQWDRDEFFSLLFEVHGSADAGTEERAFRWRTSRLEEKGLLEFEEAVEIYGYIAREEARRMVRAREPVPRFMEARETPSYPIRLAGGRTFLARVLAGIEDRDLRNRLRGEIAFSANRLLVADGGPMGEVESMQKAVKRLFSFVNVGLLFLSEGDSELARDALDRIPIRELFQIGFSRAVDLKSSAARTAGRWWPKWRTQGFRLLVFPEEGVMTGLMRRVPQYYALGWGGDVDFRDFESMDEIRRTGEILDEIISAADACFGRLGVPEPSYAGLESGDVFTGGVEEIDLGNLLATGFVNFALVGSFDITPVEKRAIGAVFEATQGGAEGGRRRLKQESVARFLAWLMEKSRGADVGWPSLERFARKALAELEDELKGVPSLTDLDPRYVRSVLLLCHPEEEERGE
jgi:hypothetical protein